MEVSVPAALQRSSKNNPEEDGMDVDHEGPLARDTSECKYTYNRFVLPQVRKFTAQYSHVYQKRMTALKPVVKREAQRLWGEVAFVDRVIDLDSSRPTCVLVGTLYKIQQLKPSVLDEFASEFSGKATAPTLDNFCSDEDEFVLEDESGRVNLVGLEQMLVDSLVSGLVVALQGRLDEEGRFVVSRYCFPGHAAQPERRLVSSKPEKQRFLMLVSGLRMGAGFDSLPFQLLTEYICGHIGNSADHNLESEIVRVVIAGSSVDIPEEMKTKDDATGSKERKFGKSRGTNQLVEPIKQLDCALAEIASSICVDVIPGPSDPVNVTMPQQPLHKCLFPHAGRFQSSFKLTTNPYECVLEEDVLVLGHGGQPVLDMLMYTRNRSPVDLMEETLQWRHIAPTAPDTLPCYPLTSIDPFVMQERPHLYFCGNQTTFEQRLVQSEHGGFTRVVAVPEFSKTGQVVLVDLNSERLECTTIQFDGLDSSSE